MARTTKSRALYKTPFCKAYWVDAAAELKDAFEMAVDRPEERPLIHKIIGD